MKKTLLLLFTAAAFVGCEQPADINEPAGAERDVQLEREPMERDTGDTNTNTLSDPSGAYSPEQ